MSFHAQLTLSAEINWCKTNRYVNEVPTSWNFKWCSFSWINSWFWTGTLFTMVIMLNPISKNLAADILGQFKDISRVKFFSCFEGKLLIVVVNYTAISNGYLILNGVDRNMQIFQLVCDDWNLFGVDKVLQY